MMKRVTVAIPDDLAAAVKSYIGDQKALPPFAMVVQAALREYLSQRGYLRPVAPFRITPARRGSGCQDISQEHDRYLAER